MNKTHFSSYEELSQKAAAYVFDKITTNLLKNGKYTIGLPTGSTPIGMYKELIELFKQQPNLDLSNLHTFNLDEYYPIKQSDPQSYYAFMLTSFWRPLSDINSTFNIEKQAHIPNGETANPEEESRQFEELIVSCAGLDLTILGVGTNGHIGFNEPGADPASRTRLITLTPESRQANSKFYSSIDEVPTQALTMGMGTIMESKEILLLAGSDKQAIIAELLKNEVNTRIPVTFLVNHPHFTLFSVN